MTKYENELDEAIEAAQRVRDEIRKLKADMPQYLMKDMATVMAFLNTTAVNKIDEIKTILD